MVFKQVIFNLLEYFWLYCTVGRRIEKVDNMFAELEELKKSDWKALSKNEVKVAKADL